ncbi:MAG: hypothetical protein ABSH20_22715 [Tepidisphaeraceae bacterium]|jgi:hypothetical protein
MTNTTYSRFKKPLFEEQNTPAARPKPVEPAKASQTRASRRNTAWIIVAVLLFVGSAWGGYYLWTHRTPSPTGDINARVRYMSSIAFANLPPEKQQPYLDTARNDFEGFRKAAQNLPENQRQQAWDVFQASRLRKQLDEYFALASLAEREAYLDKQIAEFEARRAQWDQRRAAAATQPSAQAAAQQGGGGPGANPSGTGSRGTIASRIMSRLEFIPPGQRAQAGQYFGDMRQRQIALGLQPAGGRGGRGGRGR